MGDDSLTASKKDSPNTQLASKIEACFGDKFGLPYLIKDRQSLVIDKATLLNVAYGFSRHCST
jgi:hypothetical protein